MLRLVLLEMAGAILSERAADKRMVSILRETTGYRRNQRLVLFLADCRERESLVSAAE